MLAPFLTGEVQHAYYSLTANAVSNYDTLKAEILARALASVSYLVEDQPRKKWWRNILWINC